MSAPPPTVLCVDVDRHFLGILGKAFEDEGFSVLRAEDGEQAFRVVRDERPRLVVLDVALPKRDGFAVLQAIRRLPDPIGQTPVLLTCGGRVTPQYEARAAKLGASGVLGKPVPLKDLVAQARVLLSGAAAKKAGRRKAASTRGAGKSSDESVFEGNFTDLRFPHSLHRLHGLRATGVLMVSTARKKKAVQLRDGHPVAVKSNLVTECLGPYLVRTGRLSAEAAAESIARSRQGEGMVGEILVAMDEITKDEVELALKAQAEEKLFEMFSWRRGQFHLTPGSRLKRANPLTLEASPVNIILAGIRQRTHLADVDAFMSRNEDRQMCVVPASLDCLGEIDLAAEELELLGAIDGSVRLGEVATGDERLRRTLYGLLATELLELRPREGRAPSPAAQAEDGEATAGVELAALAERLRGKNHFEVLGVHEKASAAAVEKAFQVLSKQTDPAQFENADPNVKQMAEELFGWVSAAYEVLCDSESRDRYLEELQAKNGAPGASKRQKVTNSAAADRASIALAAFRKGEALMNQKSYESALREFGAAREGAPRNADYLAFYAWCLHLGNPNNETVKQEALALLRQSVRLARNTEKPYLLLGRMNKVLGETREAEKMFSQAVQILPDCVEALRELRLMNMRKGKTHKLIGKLIRR